MILPPIIPTETEPDLLPAVTRPLFLHCNILYGPKETTRLTDEFGLTRVPAAGLWLITFPFGTVVLCAEVTVPTTNTAL